MPKKAKVAKQKIELSLLAPNAFKVRVCGNWDGTHDGWMKKGKDGRWRTSVQLSDGEYSYNFLVTDEEQQAPYSITDPEGYQFQRYAKASCFKVVNGQRADLHYEWQHDDVPMPENRDLVIYELHVGDFSGELQYNRSAGTFAQVVERLDYLQDLGINAIELMPVTQSASNDNWGYSQISLWGVNYRYGPIDELARLVDEAHARGMRVIFDGVYNHLSPEAPLERLDHDYWFYPQNPDPPELQFGPKLNYEFFDKKHNLYPAREYTLGSINRWINELHGDGMRFDSTQALKFHDLVKWMDEQAESHSDFKPYFSIAEQLPEEPEIAGPDKPVDCAWHETLRQRLEAVALANEDDDSHPFDTDALLDAMDARKSGYPSNHNVINYANNHDHERLLYRLGSERGIFEDAAFRRMKLIASLLLTAPGIPMLWMGEEFGQATDRGENHESRPLEWKLLENRSNCDLFKHYRHHIWMRRDNPAFTSDNFEVVASIPNQAVVAYKRWDADGNTIFVLANLKDGDSGQFNLAVDSKDDDCWHELTRHNNSKGQPTKLPNSLRANEVRIFKKT